MADQEKWCGLCGDPARANRYYCQECKMYSCDYCSTKYGKRCNKCQEIIYCCNKCGYKKVYDPKRAQCWMRECSNILCVKCNNSAEPCKKSACTIHDRKMCVYCKRAECCNKDLHCKICVIKKCNNLICYGCFLQHNTCNLEHEDSDSEEQCGIVECAECGTRRLNTTYKTCVSDDCKAFICRDCCKKYDTHVYACSFCIKANQWYNLLIENAKYMPDREGAIAAKKDFVSYL